MALSSHLRKCSARYDSPMTSLCPHLVQVGSFIWPLLIEVFDDLTGFTTEAGASDMFADFLASYAVHFVRILAFGIK